MADKYPPESYSRGRKWLLYPKEKRFHSLVRLLKDRPHERGCEIGVRNGVTTLHLLKSLPGLKTMYCIDPWQVETEDSPASVKWPIRRFNTFKRWSRPVRDRIVVLRKYSQDARDDIKPNSLDFIFIDGDHRYDPVMNDIRLALLWVKPGGLIAGHDFINGVGKWAVKRAVEEMFGHNYELAGDQVWYTWKV